MGTFQGRNLLSAISRLKKASRLKQATVKCKSYAKCIFATICQTEAGVTGRASTARWASRRPCGRSRRARRRAATGSAAPTRRRCRRSLSLPRTTRARSLCSRSGPPPVGPSVFCLPIGPSLAVLMQDTISTSSDSSSFWNHLTSLPIAQRRR